MTQQTTEAVTTRAAERRSGAHALLEALAQRGMTHLFGVPGHGAYPIYDAINDFPGLRTVVGRHEQSITFAAIGYAWSTGGTAVATSVPAAGLTNAATSLLEATLSQDRLLFLLESDPLQRDILRSVARHYARADRPDDIAPAAHELLDRLETGRPGTAALEVPNEVLNSFLPGEPEPWTPAALPGVPEGLLAGAARAFSDARRVAILAGATAVSADAAESIRTLAESLGAPVFTDGFSKGVLSEDHPLALGHSWTASGPGERLLQQADVVLVIGAPVAAAQNTVEWHPSMVVGSRPPERLARQLILVDWDDEVQAPLPARLRVQGHVPTILAELAARLERRPVDSFEPELLDEVRRLVWSYAEERIPWALAGFRGLRAAVPADGILLTDSLVGVWLDRLYPAYGPRLSRFPCGTGTLGWGVPAAVGVKLAQPEREVVVVAGDGAFLYNPQELATMLLYGLKVTVVVANDDCYSAIKHNMTENFGRSSAHALENPDFVQFGEAFGMRAVRLAGPDELGPAVAESIAGETSTLIEVPLELRPPAALYEFSVGYTEGTADAFRPPSAPSEKLEPHA